jgi:ribosomal protein L1
MVKKDAKKDVAFAESEAGAPVSKGMRGKVEDEIEQEAEVELSEQEILKQAEEREKERKELEKEEKEAAKEEEKEEKAKEHKDKIQKKTQVRIKPRHGKKYRKLAEKIEANKEYPLEEAIELVLATNPAKFDATVEMHVRLNEKEKNTRGMVVLPGGVVKVKKILEVLENNVDQVIADVKAGKAEFDIMVADMKVMPKLAQLAKVLGPKGLMPSPKAGTVVADVKKAADELRGGKVEFRADKDNNVHMAVGKISFGAEKIKQNFQAILDHLPKKINSIHITTTMGPSIKISKK